MSCLGFRVLGFRVQGQVRFKTTEASDPARRVLLSMVKAVKRHSNWQCTLCSCLPTRARRALFWGIYVAFTINPEASFTGLNRPFHRLSGLWGLCNGSDLLGGGDALCLGLGFVRSKPYGPNPAKFRALCMLRSIASSHDLGGTFPSFWV